MIRRLLSNKWLKIILITIMQISLLRLLQIDTKTLIPITIFLIAVIDYYQMRIPNLMLFKLILEILYVHYNNPLIVLDYKFSVLIFIVFVCLYIIEPIIFSAGDIKLIVILTLYISIDIVNLLILASIISLLLMMIRQERKVAYAPCIAIAYFLLRM